MSTFQERFSGSFDAEAKRRIENGEPKLTKTMVWKAAKMTSGAFTQWYDGTTGAKLSTCFDIAPLLRVNPHWLFDESQEKLNGLSPSSDTKKPFANNTPPQTAEATAATYAQIKAVIAGVLNAYGLDYADLVPNEKTVESEITAKLLRLSNTVKPVKEAESVLPRTARPGELESGVATDESTKESPRKRAEGER